MMGWWWPPLAPSCLLWDSTHIWGWGQAAALSSLSVVVNYRVLHELPERGDREEGNESALSTQLQNKYRTPRAGPLPP